RIAAGCVAMAAVVVSFSYWVGDWTAIASPWHRVGWLLAVVAAGASAYGVALIVMGLRPRDLRH
ncbi:MAG: murein biosynthesis integral membrane protein MurJ, partial [Gammaproteobacteria bacterium]|nr:murein biosynthesis integral membrane protein MurJ [Gammaproteobacteria bacterium]